MNEDNNSNHKKENSDEQFPGYPHYPAKEDIMNSKNDQRVNLDLENLTKSNQISSSAAIANASGAAPADNTSFDPLEDAEDELFVQGTDADVTSEDLKILGDKDADFGTTGLHTGDDLDVPGSENDDDNELIGEEDEENNYYSLGGDAHENLEEDNS